MSLLSWTDHHLPHATARYSFGVLSLELICREPSWPWSMDARAIVREVVGGAKPPLLKQLHQRLTTLAATVDAQTSPDAKDMHAATAVSVVESIVQACLSTDPAARPSFTEIVKKLYTCSDGLKLRPRLPDGFDALFDVVQKAANQLTAPLDDVASASISVNVLRLDFDSGKWVPRFIVVDRSRRQLDEFKR